MDQYIKRGNIYKAAEEKRGNDGNNDATKANKDILTLQNRCKFFTGGAFCRYCDIKCLLRTEKYNA